MAHYVAALNSIFYALTGPGRRLMLEQLRQGSASVSELGKLLPMSPAAVVQHVQVLEASGLVWAQKLGRTGMCSLNLVPLRSAEWSLDCLGQYLAETTETTDKRTRYSLVARP